MPSLKELIVISQDEPYVQVFSRRAENQWLYGPFEGLTAVAKADTFGIDLPLVDLYAGAYEPPAMQ